MPHTPALLSSSIAGRAPPLFSCSSTTDTPGVVCVHLSGELDLVGAPELARTLRNAQRQARLVVLDMRELTFMDSSGVHVIVAASKNARLAGRRLVVLRGPRNVDGAFTLTGTSGELETYDLDPPEPPGQVMLQLAAEVLAA
jgi:anti-sigma B factor antagonist